MYDAAGGLFYVGKARNLRRRLAQYRTARRTKKDRKRRTLVRSADRIEWQVCASLFSDQSESRSGYPEFPNFWEYPSATDRGSVGHSGGQVRCACARD